MAAPITPSDSPPANDLLPIDPDLTSIDDHPQTENPIETGDVHDTLHTIITGGPVADTSDWLKRAISDYVT